MTLTDIIIDKNQELKSFNYNGESFVVTHSVYTSKTAPGAGRGGLKEKESCHINFGISREGYVVLKEKENCHIYFGLLHYKVKDVFESCGMAFVAASDFDTVGTYYISITGRKFSQKDHAEGYAKICSLGLEEYLDEMLDYIEEEKNNLGDDGRELYLKKIFEEINADYNHFSKLYYQKGLFDSMEGCLLELAHWMWGRYTVINDPRIKIIKVKLDSKELEESFDKAWYHTQRLMSGKTEMDQREVLMSIQKMVDDTIENHKGNPDSVKSELERNFKQLERMVVYHPEKFLKALGCKR